MQHQRTTGLTTAQFTTLLTALTHQLTWGKPSGRPPAVSLSQALKITLLYHRHNLTEELLAELFDISQPTVSRTINQIEKALTKILEPLTPQIESALKVPDSLVIDGTLIPTWNWRSRGKINFSGKHKRVGFNHQVICTLDGKPLVIPDPLPGAKHDAFAFKEHGLEKYLNETTLADKGYVGLGLLTPIRRKPGVKVPQGVKDNNRIINRLRAVVERVIA